MFPCLAKILAIAKFEAGNALEHCENNAVIRGRSNNEIGLMQILPGSCPGKNLFDVNENIECALEILKDKYDYYYPTNQNDNENDNHDYSYDSRTIYPK